MTADVRIPMSLAFETGVKDSPRPATTRAAGMAAEYRIELFEDLGAIEQEWRAFQEVCDCTVFQTYQWLSTWQRHIGSHLGWRPAIVAGRCPEGDLEFLFPLAVLPNQLTRRLTWLGSQLCDYNAPLLAPGFDQRTDAARFVRLWRAVLREICSRKNLRFDLIRLCKMPQKVGGRPNPFLALRTSPNANGAYLTSLFGDWPSFYAAKRSSSTRRRDRTKRGRLSEFGEVRFVSPSSAGERAATLDTLIQQKSGWFAAAGVRNIFTHPGHRDFYNALATGETLRELVHIGRLDIGAAPAASNMGLTFRGTYYHLLASYDTVSPTARFGPGAAHIRELLGYAIGRGFTVFDFTIGDEPYKRDWSDTTLVLADHLSPATLRGAIAFVPLVAISVIKRWIKQTPVLWKMASAFRARVAWLRR